MIYTEDDLGSSSAVYQYKCIESHLNILSIQCSCRHGQYGYIENLLSLLLPLLTKSLRETIQNGSSMEIDSDVLERDLTCYFQT
jgi:hypothetical protein